MNLESRILASQPTIPWVTTCKLAALNSVFLSVKWGSFPSLPPTSKASMGKINYLTTSNCGTFCAVTILLSAFPLKARSFHFVIILGFGRLSLTAGGLFRGVCRQGFSATRPAAWMLAYGRRSIFQSIKPESLDAAQENNIAKACWWLSSSQPSRLPHYIECETT